MPVQICQSELFFGLAGCLPWVAMVLKRQICCQLDTNVFFSPFFPVIIPMFAPLNKLAGLGIASIIAVIGACGGVHLAVRAFTIAREPESAA